MGDSGRGFRRYHLETLAVLSGILIAFGLDAGWGVVQERGETRESLANLQREFEGTRAQLDSVVVAVERATEASLLFFSLEPHEVADLPIEDMRLILVGLRRADTFDPGESALAALVAGNILERIDDVALRELIASWSGRVNDLREE